MARRSKRMVTERVQRLASYEFEGSFEQIEAKLQSIRDDHPHYEKFSVDIDYERDYGDTDRYAVFVIYGQRPETAEDRKKAAAERAKLEADAVARRREQFEKLKKEFET
jgi:hypothetical protein